ncbi:MAG: hypothetical protein MI741_06975, partial [Rhodospirillales bacterium]|nr:hypothetical protein [Rhodospirillales bacterium]
MSEPRKRWSFFKDNSASIRRILGANLATNILPGSFGILLYFLVAELTDYGRSDGAANGNTLEWLCAVYVGLFVIYIASSMWSQKVSYMNAYGVSTMLRLKLGDKLRRLPMSFFKKNDPGDITSRVLGDVQKSENIVARVLPDLVEAAVTPVILGGFLLIIDTRLAVIAIGIVATAGIFLYLARRVVKNLGKR